MVNLFHLDHIIRYKKGMASEKAKGLLLVRNYLSALRVFEPPLRPGEEVEGLFYELIARLRGKALKHYEDLLDAYFCAYLAFHYWRFGRAGSEMIGDVDTGYIIVPHRAAKPPALGEGPATFVNPVRFIVEEGRTYFMETRSARYPVSLRWMPDDFPEGRSVAFAQTYDREHGLGLQRIDSDTEDELRGLSGMVGEFVLRHAPGLRWNSYSGLDREVTQPEVPGAACPCRSDSS